MTIDGFWSVIDGACARFPEDAYAKQDCIADAVRRIPLSEATDFYSHFIAEFQRANTWDLVGAAHVMMGGCGDDGFMDFREFLISLGRKRFEAAMANADSLADLPEALEEPMYMETYFSFLHEIIDDEDLPEIPHHPPLQGENVGEDGWLEKYPRLKARFWDADE